MKYRRIRQIMTGQVAAVRPDTLFQEAVGLRQARHFGAAPPGEAIVAVREGTVSPRGRFERRSQNLLAVVLPRRADGVVKVVDRLSFSTDDTGE